MTMRRNQTWLVWEEEYADEGSWEIRARSAWEAKRKYRKACGMTGPESDSPLRAALMTPEIAAARRAMPR